MQSHSDVQSLAVTDLSAFTCIKKEDVIQTLKHLNLVKYCKGQHVIAANAKVIQQHLQRINAGRKRALLTVDRSRIQWRPRLEKSTKGSRRRGAQQHGSSGTHKRQRTAR